MPAPTYRVDEALLEYATEKQREYLRAINEHRGIRPASRALEVNYSTVNQALVRVKEKAALMGYSPEHDLHKRVAPGFTAKGHSTAYRMDKPGKPAIIQWVKTQRDDEQRERIIRDAITALMDDVPRIEPVLASEGYERALCNVYTLTDSHVGMYAWGKETGEDWDLRIAETVLCGVFARMVDGSPAAETACVVNLGDFLHFDSLVAETPTNRHVLDADSRYSKVVAVAVKVMRFLVTYALRKHRRVIVVIAEGNHDMAGSVWLRHMFKLLFEQEPRVEIVDSELPYYVHQHGRTMLAWHHGHLKKKEGLPLVFAAQFPQAWGATTKRYIHCGHQHHVDEKEHPGVYVIQHPTLAARDAYAARGGWIAERKATAMTYHAVHGEVARTTVTPEMLLPADDKVDERRSPENKA